MIKIFVRIMFLSKERFELRSAEVIVRVKWLPENELRTVYRDVRAKQQSSSTYVQELKQLMDAKYNVKCPVLALNTSL